MSNNPFNLLGGLSKSPRAQTEQSPGVPQGSSQIQHQPIPENSQPPQEQQQEQPRPPKKRKGHRGGKKKRQRRKSFAIIDDDENHGEQGESAGQPLYQIPSGNLSGTSFSSEALLDHRDHQQMRPRRSSTIGAATPGVSLIASPFSSQPGGSRLRATHNVDASDDDGFFGPDERAPLLSTRSQTIPSSHGATDSRTSRPRSHGTSSVSSNAKRAATAFGSKERYDVNHPPSVPASPTFSGVDRIDMTLGDVMIRDELDLRQPSPRRPIPEDDGFSNAGDAIRDNRPDQRLLFDRHGEEDVCFPGPGMSEMGDEETHHRTTGGQNRIRRRRGQWPDLSILEEWKHMEKEDRSEERRVKTITEPQLINGRLRPVRKGWFETEEDMPYRFTYFNEEFESTIHAQTISELCQPGGDFQELFIPEPRVLSDDESDREDETSALPAKLRRPSGGVDGESRIPTRQSSFMESKREDTTSPARDSSATGTSGRETPNGIKSPGESTTKPPPTSTPEPDAKQQKSSRLGDRPVWWLDILSPTEAEMKVISKAFGIHPLTAEDIMLQEAREKVELFRNYYFVNYRTFDQDINSENYLEPVNMYVVVFREGVLSFHFSVSPHPANVRRRIRQLTDYLILTSDWISYAIIDDITDVFQPLIQNIEDEVDEIDEAILRLHSVADKRLKDEKNIASQKHHDDATTVAESTGDMLRRVGDCRKRVMSLYRLLGNKADVIKGFAKRCNERWEVAPRSEIGLYLGDIQDHIITMTSNLGHYEKILARSHGNYLAQINIRMNERQEQTADVLGKLTVLGTIVLPMNIITGLWGMNVWVPGQEYEGDLTWFWCITAGLIMFGLGCYITAKRVYGIV